MTDESINLRRRLIRDASRDDERRASTGLFHVDVRSRSSSVLPITALCALFFVGMCLFLASLAIIDDLPTPVVDDVDDKFNARRVMNILMRLESFGPKVTGSFENEVMAVELLIRNIGEIQKEAKSHHNITYEIQRVNGSFHLSKPISETLVYFYVQNIVVRLSGSQPGFPSLLINCHFDSVPTSPGSSDDGANCAIMLETLRVLSLGPKLKHDVIFLFNGAEENPLMASHGFITKHPSARNVKAFINLESCGAGGKEVLFQSGPKNYWLLQKYAQVPHPSALVVAEEIFQSGLVPSDTDFRVFRDYGEIPGLDFAHCLNGYVYHTKYDRISSIVNALGVFQHTGDNLLSLIKSIVNSDDFSWTPKFTDLNPVYFDVFGKYFFLYDAKSVVNWLVFFFAAGTILLVQPTAALLKRTLTFTIMIVSSIVINLMIAFLIDYFGISLSWYSNMALIIQLYFMPPFILSSLILIHMENYFENRLVNNDCPKRWFSMYLNFLAMHLFWTLMFGVGITMGIRSSYLLIFLIGPNALMLAILSFMRIRSGKLWTIFYVLSTIISSVNFSHLGILVFYLFIPIAGRAGDSKNPDYFISLMSAVLFFVIFCYMLPLMFLVKSNKRFLWTMAAFNLFAVVVACNTSFSFPFSEFKPQRLIAKHVNREIYSFNSSITNADSIIWVQSLDRRGLTHYSNPEFKKSRPLESFCELDAHCGIPWPSARSYLQSTSSLSFYTSPHKVLNDFSVNYQKEQLATNVRRYHFVVSGQPDHMVMFIRPRPSAELYSWTFPFDSPIPRVKYGTYVVRYVHGHQRPSFKFSIDMKHEEGKTKPLMDIAIVAEKTHETKFSDFFTVFLTSLPNYAHVTPVVSYYKSFIL